MFTVAALYHFFDFQHYQQVRESLKVRMVQGGIKGSLLLAMEGINGTIGGEDHAMADFLRHLETEIIGEPFEYKLSYSEKAPFRRSKVRLKKETISLGEVVDPSMRGEYVEANHWNALIDDPETIVLDTRNDYEVHMGTFARATNPQTKNFKQLPDFVRTHLPDAKDKKIATFCTGGIRCEKFTAWLAAQGYQNVYHLKGGILKYLEDIPESESRWQGECFVFDGRVAVGHGLVPSQEASMCFCGHPLTPEDRQHPDYIKDKRCGFCPGANADAENA